MSLLQSDFVIGSRFNGPPSSGNGGYVSGRLAQFIEGPAQVTLRMPPLLDHPMVVEAGENGKVLLKNGDQLVAEAVAASLELTVPEPPDWETTVEASKSYIGFQAHLYPSCFVCGPDRPHEDGLHIYAGPVKGREGNMVAAPWTPKAELANEQGVVAPEYIWGSLDCPGAYTLPVGHLSASVILLGRLTTELIQPVYADQPYRVIGWYIGQEGRKHYTGTAIYSSQGELCGKAKAIWIELKVEK